MLILQIALTIAAWRKGWRQRAVVPVATALLVGILGGAVIGASGGRPEAAAPLFILGDLLCLAVLIGMSRTAPAGAGAPEAAAASALPEAASNTVSPFASGEPIAEQPGR